MARHGLWHSREMDEQWLKAVNRALRKWGFEGKGVFVNRNGVLKVRISHPIMCVDDAWIEMSFKPVQQLAWTYMTMGDTTGFLRNVLVTYFMKVGCQLRDAELKKV